MVARKKASPGPTSDSSSTTGWRPDGCERVAMVLQGGGALGAYQAGVYQALHENGMEPDWVSGVSIGGINSAIIAGNTAKDRLPKLREFWETISGRKSWAFTPDGDVFRKVRNASSSLMAMLHGQPGFFSPRHVNPWLSHAGGDASTSFYDTAPLKETLLRLVDFDLLNNGPVQFAVGAVNVTSGNFVYFDNRFTVIEPEHIMASGALPPALPMVEINNSPYWDGGIVSNTPLAHLLDREDKLNTLVIQVDLFSAKGKVPHDMPEVLARHKDIMYSSRTRANTDSYRKLRHWKNIALQALSKVPANKLDPQEKKLFEDLSTLPDITLLQLIYQQQSHEGHSKDYDFSSISMREHWTTGYEDTRKIFQKPELLNMPKKGSGITVHDVRHETSDLHHSEHKLK
jgi:NTE family protein